ncbi:MAG TPA: metallopeptidase family protein [Aestuariivirgaceae bacterium]
MARRAFDGLPEAFRTLCSDVVIKVEEEATQEVLDHFGIEDELELMGLFQGVGLAQGGGLRATGSLPNMVFLYRRPILTYWAEHRDSLEEVVTHVLVHEIGHHFGLSDDDMAKLERSAK